MEKTSSFRVSVVTSCGITTSTPPSITNYLHHNLPESSSLGDPAIDANQEANAGYNQEASADHEQEDQIEAEQGINKFPIMDTIAGILEDDRYN